MAFNIGDNGSVFSDDDEVEELPTIEDIELDTGPRDGNQDNNNDTIGEMARDIGDAYAQQQDDERELQQQQQQQQQERDQTPETEEDNDSILGLAQDIGNELIQQQDDNDEQHDQQQQQQQQQQQRQRQQQSHRQQNRQSPVHDNEVHPDSRGVNRYLPPLREQLNENDRFPDHSRYNWKFSPEFITSIHQDTLGEDTHPNDHVPPADHLHLNSGIQRENATDTFRPKRRKVQYLRFNNLRGQLTKAHNSLRNGPDEETIEPHPDFRDLRRSTTLKRYDTWIPIFDTEDERPPADPEYFTSDYIKDLRIFPCEGPAHFLRIVQEYFLCDHDIRRAMRDYCDSVAYEAYRRKHQLRKQNFRLKPENRQFFIHVSDRPLEIFPSPLSIKTNGYVIISPSGYYPTDFVRRVHIRRRPSLGDSAKAYGTTDKCRPPYGSSIRYGTYDSSYLKDPAPIGRNFKQEQLFRYRFYNNNNPHQSIQAIENNVLAIPEEDLDGKIREEKANMLFLEKQEAMQIKNPYTWSMSERMDFLRYRDRQPQQRNNDNDNDNDKNDGDDDNENFDDDDNDTDNDNNNDDRRNQQDVSSPLQLSSSRQREKTKRSSRSKQSASDPGQERRLSLPSPQRSAEQQSDSLCDTEIPSHSLDELSAAAPRGIQPTKEIRGNLSFLRHFFIERIVSGSSATVRRDREQSDQHIKTIFERIKMPKPWTQMLVDNTKKIDQQLSDVDTNEIIERLKQELRKYHYVYTDEAIMNESKLLRSILENARGTQEVYRIEHIIPAAFRQWRSVAHTYQQMIYMMTATTVMKEGMGILLKPTENKVFYDAFRTMLEENLADEQAASMREINYGIYAGIRAEIVTFIVDPRLIQPSYVPMPDYEEREDSPSVMNLMDDPDVSARLNGEVITPYIEAFSNLRNESDIWHTGQELRYASLVHTLRVFICRHAPVFEENVKRVVQQQLNRNDDVTAIARGAVELMACHKDLDTPFKITPNRVRTMVAGCGRQNTANLARQHHRQKPVSKISRQSQQAQRQPTQSASSSSADTLPVAFPDITPTVSSSKKKKKTKKSKALSSSQETTPTSTAVAFPAEEMDQYQSDTATTNKDLSSLTPKDKTKESKKASSTSKNDLIQQQLHENGISHPSNRLLNTIRSHVSKNRQLSINSVGSRLKMFVERFISSSFPLPPISNDRMVIVASLLSYANPNDSNIFHESIVDYNRTNIWNVSDNEIMGYIIDATHYVRTHYYVDIDPLQEQHRIFIICMNEYLQQIRQHRVLTKRNVMNALFAGLGTLFIHHIASREVLFNTLFSDDSKPADPDKKLREILDPFSKHMLHSVRNEAEREGDGATMDVIDALWMQFSKTGQTLIRETVEYAMERRNILVDINSFIEFIQQKRKYLGTVHDIMDVYQEYNEYYNLVAFFAHEPTSNDVSEDNADFSVMGGGGTSTGSAIEAQMAHLWI